MAQRLAAAAKELRFLVRESTIYWDDLLTAADKTLWHEAAKATLAIRHWHLDSQTGTPVNSASALFSTQDRNTLFDGKLKKSLDKAVKEFDRLLRPKRIS